MKPEQKTYEVGDRRINPAAKERLEKLNRTKNPRKALELLVDIYESHVYREEKTQNGWGPICPFTPHTVNGYFENISEFKPQQLDSQIVEILKKRPIALVRESYMLIVRYVPAFVKAIGHDYGYAAHRTDPYICIEEGELFRLKR